MTVSSTPADRRWSSRFAFLMASIGAAVGLGNLWRFPFQAGENGGSAFVFVYLLCIVLLAYPVLIAELAVGRRGGRSAVGSTSTVAQAAGASPLWGMAGLVGIIATYSVLTIYGVIAGKVLAFSVSAFATPFWENAAVLHAGPLQTIAWQTLFMAITTLIVTRGLQNGIERWSVFLMPVFFLMLVGLCLYALATGAAGPALDYLFTPRFNEITPAVVLAAMGQAFFSVAVGGAAMLTYGAYLDKDKDIASNGAIIVGADTLVALVAGIMIFPIVFQFNLDPAEGMGLIFSAMPAAFADMPFGAAIGGLFFLLAFVAALTSSIAMLMIPVAAAQDFFKLNRTVAACGLGALAWLIGAISVLWPHLSELIDFFSGQIAMPIGALLIAIFSGWIMPTLMMREELSSLSAMSFSVWKTIIRIAAPLAIGAILILGLISA